ncbi:MAG: glycosyl hydrolase 115 family protein [Mangrovibacterium sp.]
MNNFSRRLALLISSLIVILSYCSYGQPPELRLRDPVVIYTSSQPGDPVYKAIEALQQDIEKVSGNKSTIQDLSVVDRPGIVILNSKRDQLVDPLPGWEAHRVSYHTLNENPQVILQGSDMRGTIYAVYTFSEKILGVPPLWYYCGWKPDQKKEIRIPCGLDIRCNSPEVKYRAWFPNDMDLLTPWRKLSQTNNEIWLETALRLKLNTIEWLDAGERTFTEKYSVSPTTELINQYGLIYTTHHHSPLNASFENWDNYWKKIRNTEPPELLLENEEELEAYWRYNIETIKRAGLEVIWVIGFRGAGDHPFWETFKDAPASLEERGEVISRMLKKQRDLVIEITGNPDAQFRTIFYDELSDLLADGYIHPPDDPTLIWNFVAARRDHYPNEDLQKLDPGKNLNLGYYFNYQFTSTGSHLAPAEGPWKMEQNYRYVDQKSRKPILFSVVNAGNIREHVMELAANAAMMWDMKNYSGNRYITDFCAQYYGSLLADTIATLYRDYYNAFWNPKRNDLEGFNRQYIFQDLRYRRAIMQITSLMDKPYNPNPLTDLHTERLPGRTFRIVPADNNATSQVDAIINGTTQSGERFLQVKRSAEKIEKQLKGYQQVFFHDNLLSRTSFMYYLNRCLLSIAKAYSLEPGSKRLGLVQEAFNAAKNAREALNSTGYGPFQFWYDHNRVFDIDQMVRLLENRLNRERELRLKSDVQEFRKQDSIQAPLTNAILFMGSSSFTRWTDVQEYFPEYKIINRGFGGSMLTDQIKYAGDIVFPYRPKQIVIYCGENDLSKDTVNAEMTFNRFRELYTLVRDSLKEVSVVYVSMKPSPRRKAILSDMVQANRMISDFLEKEKNARYVDVYFRMLKPDGYPKGEIFTADSLHMNAKGYVIWKEAIEPVLMK